MDRESHTRETTEVQEEGRGEERERKKKKKERERELGCMGVGGVGRVRVTQYWYRRLLYIQMWDKNKMNPVFAGPGVEVCTRFQFCYSACTQRTQMKTKPQKEAPPLLYGN